MDYNSIKQLYKQYYIVSHTKYKLIDHMYGAILEKYEAANGVLVNDTENYCGYSETLKMFMYYLDIECLVVRGVALQSNHTWDREKYPKCYG